MRPKDSLDGKAIADIRKMEEFLKHSKVQHYFHCGFAMYVQGLDGDLDDCDIRVKHDSLEELGAALTNDGFLTELVPPGQATRNNSTNTPYLKAATIHGTTFDLVSRMRYLDGKGKDFEFPFDGAFAVVEKKRFEEMEIPVAPLEALALYYLYQRRGDNGKADLQTFASIYHNPKFSSEKFEEFIGEAIKLKKHRRVVEELYRHAKALV